MTESISDEFRRALAHLCTDERVRAAESGQDAQALWEAVDALGYTDALVAGEHGGADLSLSDAGELANAIGYAGLAHPFGETMLARALVAHAGGHANRGAIALARAQPAQDGAIVCREVSGARLARHVLVEAGEEWLLMPCDAAAASAGRFRPHASASLRWASPDQAVLRFARGTESAETLCSAVHAAAMAGAMLRVLELTVRYVGDRRQFGKAIGQFQAVQQDLAVLAEEANSAATAARIGCAGGTPLPQALLAAVAKLRACEAARQVIAIAHALHGAIGVTEEHMLGVFTARLHEWRLAPGTERACADILGRAVLADGAASISRFVVARLAPVPDAAAV